MKPILLNYLKVRLTFQKENSNSDAAIIIVSDKNQTTDIGVAQPLTNLISKSFEIKKNTIITNFNDKTSYFAIAADAEAEALRKLGADLYKSIKKNRSKALALTNLDVLETDQRYALLEGLLLSSYEFDYYKREKNEDQIEIQLGSTALDELLLKELQTVAEASSLIKTLVNHPSNLMNSVKFSEVAKEIGSEYGFDVEILHKEKIVELGMGGLLAINQGSDIPPTFNIFTYHPENAINSQPLVLVGKGIMFDTGGYSLKINGNMLTMKCDMAGGAAVLGTMAAVAGNRLPYHVIGLVPATDNRISSKAIVVDDVITMMDGTTVEVQNTDAEGRLVLADALTYAKSYNPELVIDMATLTGASAAITGPFGIAVLGNDPKNISELKNAGETTYERLVELPMWKEYRELLNSDIADISNLGGPIGGASTAAIFLQHFTDYPWIHLDIAGAAFIKEAAGYKQKGATAVPLRLLYGFIKNRANPIATR